MIRYRYHFTRNGTKRMEECGLTERDVINIIETTPREPTQVPARNHMAKAYTDGEYSIVVDENRPERRVIVSMRKES